MKKADILFPAVMSILFFVLSILVVRNHELWIDEAYHYLLARDSTTLRELIQNGAITGHPVVWNICLFLLKPFLSINTMQVFHCLCSAGTVWIICRYSPFRKYDILLMVFGYYLFYEYTIIAKNYSLGFLLIFTSLVLYKKKKNLLLIASLLGIACNLHLFILFVCLGLYLYVRSTSVYQKKHEHQADLLLGILLCVAALQIIPTQSVITNYRNYDVPEILSPDRFGRALGLMARGLLNIPDFRISSYWNSSLLFNVSRRLVYLLSAFLLAYILYNFRKSFKIALLYVLPLIFIMVFVYLAPLATGVRYWGFAYMMLILCCWLYFKQHPGEIRLRLFFTSILLVQFIVAIPTVYFDLQRPFSNARLASEKIKSANLSGLDIFVQNISQGPSLSAYTGKQVYFTGSQTFASFSYDKLKSLDDQEELLIASFEGLKHLGKDSCLLVFKKPLVQPKVKQLLNNYELKFISADSGAVVGSENYFIHLLSERR